MDLNGTHARALHWMGTLVAGIGDDRWHDATPCEEWDVRDLVNHNVYENLWAAELGAGRTIEEVGDRFDGDVLGDDPVAAYERSAEAARKAFEAPGALEAPVHVSYGPIPGAVYIRHRILDLVVHGWDVARATGQDTAIPPDLLEPAARVAEDDRELIRASGVFATDVEVPEGGDAQARLLAITGRRPD